MRIKFLINIILFFGSLIILFQASLYDINWLDYESPIEYKNFNRITLKDFKGLNRSDNSLDGMKTFAFIVTSIESYKIGNQYYVISYFHPSRSYTFNNEFENDSKLLTHELYHLHITEYCARLLRKKIKSMRSFNESDLDNAKNNIYTVEHSLQQLYDDESYHGYVLNKQLFWQKKIDSMLNSESKYIDTEININN